MRAVKAMMMAAILVSLSCERVASEPPPAPPAAPIVQPGAPGQPSRELPPGTASADTPAPVPEDIAFMQGMIHHHAQAIEMVELLKTRTNREDMKLLGQRIGISQADEIAMMKTWLPDRGASPAAHDHGSPMMPGMLSAADMTALRNARGSEFDRLFLEGMIRHHEGALTMVDDLLKTPEAGEESVIADFVSHADADQRMEIGRMRQMLKGLR